MKIEVKGSFWDVQVSVSTDDTQLKSRVEESYKNALGGWSYETSTEFLNEMFSATEDLLSYRHHDIDSGDLAEALFDKMDPKSQANLIKSLLLSHYGNEAYDNLQNFISE